MICLTALYPKTADSQFDLDYYLTTHLPLVNQLLIPFGLTSVDLRAGLAGGEPNSPPTFDLICYLNFDSVEALQQAMTTQGAELAADVPNFSNMQPIIQISQSAPN